MFRLWNVLVASIAAYAWQWSDLLVQHHWLSEKQRIGVATFATATFILHQLYLTLPRAVPRVDAERCKEMSNQYIKSMLAEYYEYLTGVYGKGVAVPAVRANVMLPTRCWFGFGRKFLLVYYWSCPDGLAYSDEELTLRWKRGQGLASWVLEHGKLAMFDSEREDLQGPSRQLSKKQQDAVGHIRSVLSVPIWDNEAVVGVLNLDSKQNVEDAKFLTSAVQTTVNAYARGLTAQCFRNGVRC